MATSDPSLPEYRVEFGLETGSGSETSPPTLSRRIRAFAATTRGKMALAFALGLAILLTLTVGLHVHTRRTAPPGSIKNGPPQDLHTPQGVITPGTSSSSTHSLVTSPRAALWSMVKRHKVAVAVTVALVAAALITLAVLLAVLGTGQQQADELVPDQPEPVKPDIEDPVITPSEQVDEQVPWWYYLLGAVVMVMVLVIVSFIIWFSKQRGYCAPGGHGKNELKVSDFESSKEEQSDESIVVLSEEGDPSQTGDQVKSDTKEEAIVTQVRDVGANEENANEQERLEKERQEKEKQAREVEKARQQEEEQKENERKVKQQAEEAKEKKEAADKQLKEQEEQQKITLEKLANEQEEARNQHAKEMEEARLKEEDERKMAERKKQDDLEKAREKERKEQEELAKAKEDEKRITTEKEQRRALRKTKQEAERLELGLTVEEYRTLRKKNKLAKKLQKEIDQEKPNPHLSKKTNVSTGSSGSVSQLGKVTHEKNEDSEDLAVQAKQLLDNALDAVNFKNPFSGLFG